MAWVTMELQRLGSDGAQDKKFPTGRVALGGWLGCCRVGNRVDILPHMEFGNWLVSIQRLNATVATGLGQLQVRRDSSERLGEAECYAEHSGFISLALQGPSGMGGGKGHSLILIS